MCPVGEHLSVLPMPLVGVGDLHVVQAHSHPRLQLPVATAPKFYSCQSVICSEPLLTPLSNSRAHLGRVVSFLTWEGPEAVRGTTQRPTSRRVIRPS